MINVLTPDLVNKIAAGEVVERPASVVKELMENAIDANASAITVRIEGGGLQSIRIEDNGDGIMDTDIPKLFHAHATSKIHSVQDLHTITSLGFRGEALASIASIAHVTLITKTKANTLGSCVTIKNGKNLTSQIASNDGTTLLIENLFYNIPARRKFMKSERIELSYIVRIFQQIALVHPTIEFQFYNGDKLVYRFHKCSQDERIKEITKINLLSLQSIYVGDKVHIEGSLIVPGTVTHLSEQYIFVNSRPIRSPLIVKAVKQAYTSYLKRDSKVSFVLFVTIDPNEVDVNVHPRKDEVRFLDQNLIFSAIYKGSTTYLLRFGEEKSEEKKEVFDFPNISVPISPSFKKSRSQMIYKSEVNQKEPSRLNTESFSTQISDKTNEIQEGDIFESLLNEKYTENIASLLFSDTQFLQIDKSLIVYFHDNSLEVVDQHAASERIQYEKFTEEFSERTLNYVIPLLPYYIELNEVDYHFSLGNKTAFMHYGIEVLDMGNNLVSIGKYSTHFPQEKLTEIFYELLQGFQDFGIDEQKISYNEKIIASLACRSAIMFNQKLNQEEMRSLITKLSKCKMPFTCAHGRPVRYSITLKELLKHLARC